MHQITTAQQIKDILEPIPAAKFIAHNYFAGFDPMNPKDGKCCALGHIHYTLSGNAMGDENGFGARDLTGEYYKKRYGMYVDISHVNNYNNVNGYTEHVIKDRVMHLLNDMIRDGY